MDGAVPAAAGWQRAAADPEDPAGRRGRESSPSCDRGTHAGRRDYAVLMLLARLGPAGRGSAAVRTGDIDWRSGTILSAAKGGHDERLPLPPDAGTAIADYCRHARPRDAGSGVLFLHARAPYGPVGAGDGRAHRETRLPAGGAGAGQRTPAAARRRDRRMRAGGAPLSEISQLLRHQHAETTSRLVGTIDPDELGPVTAPWPGQAS